MAVLALRCRLIVSLLKSSQRVNRFDMSPKRVHKVSMLQDISLTRVQNIWILVLLQRDVVVSMPPPPPSHSSGFKNVFFAKQLRRKKKDFNSRHALGDTLVGHFLFSKLFKTFISLINGHQYVFCQFASAPKLVCGVSYFESVAARILIRACPTTLGKFSTKPNTSKKSTRYKKGNPVPQPKQNKLNLKPCPVSRPYTPSPVTGKEQVSSFCFLGPPFACTKADLPCKTLQETPIACELAAREHCLVVKVRSYPTLHHVHSPATFICWKVVFLRALASKLQVYEHPSSKWRCTMDMAQSKKKNEERQ